MFDNISITTLLGVDSVMSELIKPQDNQPTPNLDTEQAVVAPVEQDALPITYEITGTDSLTISTTGKDLVLNPGDAVEVRSLFGEQAVVKVSQPGSAENTETFAVISQESLQDIVNASQAEAEQKKPEKIELKEEEVAYFLTNIDGLRTRTEPNTSGESTVVDVLPMGTKLSPVLDAEVVEDEAGRGQWIRVAYEIVAEGRLQQRDGVWVAKWFLDQREDITHIYEGANIGGAISEEELLNKFEAVWPNQNVELVISQVEDAEGTSDDELFFTDRFGNQLAEYSHGVLELTLAGEAIHLLKDEGVELQEKIDIDIAESGEMTVRYGEYILKYTDTGSWEFIQKGVELLDYESAEEEFGQEYAQAFQMLPESILTLNADETQVSESVLDQNDLQFFERNDELHFKTEVGGQTQEFIWMERDISPEAAARNNWQKLDLRTDSVEIYTDASYNEENPTRIAEYDRNGIEIRLTDVSRLSDPSKNYGFEFFKYDEEMEKWFQQYNFLPETPQIYSETEYSSEEHLNDIFEAFLELLATAPDVKEQDGIITLADGRIINRNNPMRIRTARWSDVDNGAGKNYQGRSTIDFWPQDFYDIKQGVLTIDLTIKERGAHNILTAATRALAMFLESETTLERDQDVDESGRPQFTAIDSRIVRLVQLANDTIVIVHPIMPLNQNAETFEIQID
ncbi:MAG: hypothetical protein WDZ94_01045 [Patescibacteria group bacterium]